MHGWSGKTGDRLKATADPTEQAWLTVDIAISHRVEGDFVARISFDDQASWAACLGDDPLSAFDGAMLIARKKASERAQAELGAR